MKLATATHWSTYWSQGPSSFPQCLKGAAAGVTALTLLFKVAGAAVEVAAGVTAGVTALTLLPKVVGAMVRKVHDQRDQLIEGNW